MAGATTLISIPSLKGGLVDNDPPTSLPSDACTIAENIEFFYTTLGERRLGCSAIGLPATITADPNIEAVTWMGRHLPTNTLGDAELWVLGQQLTSSYYVLTRRTKSAWSTVTADDAIDVTEGRGHRLSSVSLHGKFFIAYKSPVDQLHVWDGTYLRKTGLTQPAAPAVIDTGVGAYATTRYFRVRYVTLSTGTVLLRSEPSNPTTFTPSGTGSGALITKPASISEHETHWEVEASVDNANFYRIARLDVSTTTYTDTTAFATGYDSNPLSEPLTSYSLIPSGKYLAVDADRLLIAGSWENPVYGSRLWWTPVNGGTGVGNDERLDMTVNPYIDLDGYQGGEITGLSHPVNGSLYVFKWSHIYKVTRSGQRSSGSSYNAILLTASRGAFPGSLVEAIDQAGNPAQYFCDPLVGPMRIGNNGLEWCGRDIRNLWSRVNLAATTPVHGVFYQSKNQVHFWVALDGADHPNAKIIVHCNEMQSGVDGARRGWVTVPIGDRIADAHCSLMFSTNVDSTNTRDMILVPFIGKETWIVDTTTINNLVQQCDTGSTDAFTVGDTDAYYYGKVQGKPIFPTNIINRFGVMSALVTAIGVPDAANNFYVDLIRDYGVENLATGIDLRPTSAEETIVIKMLDSLSLSESRVIQVAFGDLDPTVNPTMSWKNHYFVMKVRQEQSS